MIQMTLTDDTMSAVLELPEVPLSVSNIDNDIEVVTLDNNITTYSRPGTTKRVINHTWAYLSDEQYEVIAGFRDRQKTLFRYPSISISDTTIVDMIGKLTLGPKEIIDDCGNVQSVNMIFRESTQMPDMGS